MEQGAECSPVKGQFISLFAVTKKSVEV